MTKAFQNDNDTWQPLSLAAGRLLLKLEEQKEAESEWNAPGYKKEEDKAREHAKAVNDGLKRIATFERRYGRRSY
jgi:hypothetical protein